jgi:hypothetical protein
MNKSTKPKVQLWITSSFIGFHQWPDAPKVVAYLRNLHRHVFGVKVTVQVTHSDRQVEFHLLKAFMDSYIGSDILPMLRKSPSMSCEQLAEAIGLALHHNNYAIVSVQVDEDGECGAEWFFSKT